MGGQEILKELTGSEQLSVLADTGPDFRLHASEGQRS